MGMSIDYNCLVSANCCYSPLRPLFDRRPSPPSPPFRRVSFSAPSKIWPPILRLQVSRGSHRVVPRAVSGSNRLNSEADEGSSDAGGSSSKEVGSLPRRRLLVQFTCDACGARTQRLINRVAYEKGTVFLQCAGCLVYHKFVDNLGLIVEYDLREELDTDNDEHLKNTRIKT